MNRKNYFNLQQQGVDVYRQIKNDHYINLDIEYWQKKIADCHNSYLLHKSEKYKSRAVIEGYTTYIQLVEIFFINLHASTLPPQQLMVGLFMTNQELRDYVNEIKDKKSENLKLYFERILKPIVEMVHKNDPTAYSDRMRLYKSTFDEVIKDYLQDYQLLNAYKHGFRITFNVGESTLSIKNNNGESYKVASSDATINYYSSGKREGKTIVYEHTASFNATRIFGKAHFMYVMLQNLVEVQKAIAKPGKKQKYRYFEVPNKDLWNKSFDSVRWKMDFAVFQSSPDDETDTKHKQENVHA